METQCIAVPTSEGQRAISILKNAKLLDTKFRLESDDNLLYLPVLDIMLSQSLLKESNIPCHVTFALLEQKKTKPKSIAEVLQPILPKELWEDIPSSFDIVGDKIIVEIKPSLDDYETDIGLAFMFVHPSVSSIYRKEGAVSGRYRVRPVKLIAGTDEPVTIHREYGLGIVVDVSKVYFSPRLSTEHARVAQLVKDGEKVLDMFCGVGSFPLHIANKVNAQVTAVDLNPNALNCLKKSIRLNQKKLKGKIDPIQSDIRDFFSHDIFDRVIMNHPSGSKNYLSDAFKFTSPGSFIHYYTFAPIEGYEEFVLKELGEFSDLVQIEGFTRIRQYSPTHYHLAVDLKRTS